jgi:hypothetical protein
MTKNADAIRRLFKVAPQHDRTGNLASMPGIYPDYPAPIVSPPTSATSQAAIGSDGLLRTTAA